MQTIKIWTDGGCYPNPGPGAYAFLVRYPGSAVVERSQGFLKTTNNRMEIRGVLHALEYLHEPGHVEVFSDSKYVVNAMSKGWVLAWSMNNWMRTPNRFDAVGGPVKNADLWRRMMVAVKRHHFVRFAWIKGHSGHPENERCDELCSKARQSTLIEDETHG